VARPTRRERDRRATEAAQASTAQSPAGTPRAGRRSRRVTQQGQRGFIDRYGGLLLLGFTILGMAVLLAVFVQSSTKTAYGCDSLLTPGPVEPVPAASSATQPSPGPTLAPDASPTPEPTPLPAPTQRLGFPVSDLGTSHVRDTNKVIDYAYCPPGSGPHWSIGGEAPAPRDFYRPEDVVEPQQWIHNLEHGFVLALYSCGTDGKSCPSEAELGQLKTIYDDTPTTAGAQTCGVPNKVIVARFDRISTKFAYVAWDRMLLADAVVPEQGITFAEQWTDSPSAPERGTCFR